MSFNMGAMFAQLISLAVMIIILFLLVLVVILIIKGITALNIYIAKNKNDNNLN